MSSSNSLWEDKKRAMEEQIDPSFSRSQLQQNDLHHLNQLGANPDSSYEVAAAAVAASGHKVNSGSSQSGNETGSSIASAGETPLSRNGRALTNTKRAAQNRSAQRAFRQRKEQHIRELEAQVKEVDSLKQTIESLRQENTQLRDYSLALQAKLIEHNDVPAPPVVFSNRIQSTKKEN